VSLTDKLAQRRNKLGELQPNVKVPLLFVTGNSLRTIEGVRSFVPMRMEWTTACPLLELAALDWPAREPHDMAQAVVMQEEIKAAARAALADSPTFSQEGGWGSLDQFVGNMKLACANGRWFVSTSCDAPKLHFQMSESEAVADSRLETAFRRLSDAWGGSHLALCGLLADPFDEIQRLGRIAAGEAQNLDAPRFGQPAHKNDGRAPGVATIQTAAHVSGLMALMERADLDLATGFATSSSKHGARRGI
jgi:hypothetical protein